MPFQFHKKFHWYKKRRSNSVLLRREIMPLAVPIFIENLSVLLMGVLSTFLVSWLGIAQMAAVGLAESFNLIIVSFFMAIALGTSVIVALSMGGKNRDYAKQATAQSMNLLLITSILLVIFVEFFGHQIIDLIARQADEAVKKYALEFLILSAWGYPALAVVLVGSAALRGAGNAKLPMYINIIMNLCNIVLSYFLIYGVFDHRGLNLFGAGLGITLSRYLGMAIIVYFLVFRSKNTFRIAPKLFFQPFSRPLLKEVLSIGIPSSIESVMFNIGKLLTQTFVAGMGTAAIAANFIAFSIVGLLNLPGSTFGSTSTIIIGKRLGMGQLPQSIRQLKYLFFITNIALCVLAIISIPFAEFFVTLYTDDAEVIEIAKILIWLNALFTPFWAASFVLPYGFKGAKDANYTMWVAIGSMWICRIVMGYFLGIVLDLGVMGVWFGMFLDWIVRSIFFYRRLKSNKWLWNYHL